MKQNFFALVALAVSNAALASESVSFVCSGTSLEPTTSGISYAYQVKGIGYRSRSIPNDIPTLTASAASINVYQISPNGSVSAPLKNGTLKDLNREEVCDNDYCSIVKNYSAPQASLGLEIGIGSTRYQPSDKYVAMDFTIKHRLSSRVVSIGHGRCQVQSLELEEEHHGTDVIRDDAGKFVLIPNSDSELPTLLKNDVFGTTINDALDETGNTVSAFLRGGFISATARNPRTKKVAIGIEHSYRMLSSFSAVYVYDPVTKTIANAPYKNLGRDIPAGTSDALSHISNLTYDNSGLLHAFVGDAAGNRFQMTFSPSLNYLGCVIVEMVEGYPSCVNGR